MTTEEIKQTWQQAACRMFVPGPDDLVRIYRQRKETALERLARKYRSFSIMSLVMTFVSLLWLFSVSLEIKESMRGPLTIVMMIYFATCSLLDYRLYKGVSGIDCYTMSVEEVINKALYYRKKHIECIIFLIPFVIVVIAAMVYAFGADTYIIYGMVAGFVGGLAIGIRHYIDFMSQYKKITRG